MLNFCPGPLLDAYLKFMLYEVKNRLFAGVFAVTGRAKSRQALRIEAVALRLYGHPIKQAELSYANRRLSGNL